MRIQISDQSEAMARARSVLLALARPGGLDGLPAAEAFFLLSNLAPPYPPAVELAPDVEVDLQEGIAALLAAGEQASSVWERDRIASAARALQDRVV